MVEWEDVNALIATFDAKRGHRGRGGATTRGLGFVPPGERVPPLVEVSRGYVVDRDANGTWEEIPV